MAPTSVRGAAPLAARASGLSAALAAAALALTGALTACSSAAPTAGGAAAAPAAAASAVPKATGATAAAPVAAAASGSRTRVHVPAPRSGPGGSTLTAQHGGLVMSEQGVDVELDAQPGYIDVWVRQNGQPVDARQLQSHVTLLNGVDITDAYLAPSAEGDRLTLNGNYRIVHGTRPIVRVTLPDGRRLTLRYLVVMLPPRAGG